MIKVAIVSASQILAHPTRSLWPGHYIVPASNTVSVIAGGEKPHRKHRSKRGWHQPYELDRAQREHALLGSQFHMQLPAHVVARQIGAPTETVKLFFTTLAQERAQAKKQRAIDRAERQARYELWLAKFLQKYPQVQSLALHSKAAYLDFCGDHGSYLKQLGTDAQDTREIWNEFLAGTLAKRLEVERVKKNHSDFVARLNESA